MALIELAQLPLQRHPVVRKAEQQRVGSRLPSCRRTKPSLQLGAKEIAAMSTSWGDNVLGERVGKNVHTPSRRHRPGDATSRLSRRLAERWRCDAVAAFGLSPRAGLLHCCAHRSGG